MALRTFESIARIFQVLRERMAQPASLTSLTRQQSSLTTHALLALLPGPSARCKSEVFRLRSSLARSSWKESNSNDRSLSSFEAKFSNMIASGSFEVCVVSLRGSYPGIHNDLQKLKCARHWTSWQPYPLRTICSVQAPKANDPQHDAEL
jgi:hypothetical protein